MDDEHLKDHINLETKSLQVTALTTQAGMALDILNFIQAVHDKDKKGAPDSRFTIPNEDKLKEAAVNTLLRYLNGTSSG